ncbi:MAG: imidazole glycerol phosphate synthase subunit HisH [Ilumatobacter sp.]|nr:imidazole glycerol phosphate synthase subunit HisH [Ilumatobacter sp.]
MRCASTVRAVCRRPRACCDASCRGRPVTRPLVAVLDYGIGNLHSAQKALERGGADARLTADRSLIADADGVVLPGVGAFGACMDALRRVGLDEAAADAVSSGRPFLGICVGMQMLFSASEEDDGAVGLGIIPGVVRWIPPGPKIPQMQWNVLHISQPADPMLQHLGDEPWVYFVHSLHGVPDDPGVVAATVEYGSTLNAAFRLDNVFAAQFHPEKSSRPGLALLSNFVRICASPRSADDREVSA